MNAVATFTFHNNTTSASTGAIYSGSEGSLINIEFDSTGTFSAIVEANINGTFKQIGTVVDLLAVDIIASTPITDDSKFYQVDLQGFAGIRVNVTEITGSLTVKGRVV